MPPDLIIDIFKYYARFVPKSVLEKIFVQPAASRLTGYDMIRAEVLAQPTAREIPGIDAYIVSINENFVSERIRNAAGFILFVEYGVLSVDHTVTEGVQQSLAVSVVRNFSDANSDNLNEIILMNRCLVMLDTILQAMNDEQNELDFCDGSLVAWPVKTEPVDPALFYGCGGWVAKFKKINTVL